RPSHRDDIRAFSLSPPLATPNAFPTRRSSDLGLHANVTVMDLDVARLGQIAAMHHGGIRTRYSTALDLAEEIRRADVVVGSVLIPGKRAPKLVTDEMVASMKPGSVLVDVAIDQG